MKPLVSIIIPIYNGKKYLENLIYILDNQTYENLQIIMVDDFSTDGSFEYLTENLLNKKKYVLLRREQKGGTASINVEYALSHVKGDYYFYLSQDDFMDLDCIEKCVYKAIENNADIVIPNCISYYSKENQINNYKYPLENDYQSILNNREAFSLSISWNIHGFNLRKMDLFRETGFDGKYYNSDEYYVRLHYLKAQKICFCDTNFYYNQNNPYAITKKFYYRQVDCICTYYLLYNIANEFGFERNVKNEIIAIINKLYVHFSMGLKRNIIDAKKQQYMRNVLNSYIPMLKREYIKSKNYIHYLRISLLPIEVFLRVSFRKIIKKRVLEYGK